MLSRKLILVTLVIILAIVFIVMLVFNKSSTVPVTKPAQAAKLDILTNKTAYQQGETVKMIISNYASNVLKQEAIYDNEVEVVSFLGKNYGIGLIEKFKEGDWQVIEPVWRCDNPCFSPCDQEHRIEPGEKKVFSWDQTILLCDFDNQDEEIINAGAGKYRISSGLWNEEKQTSEVIYSSEFVISK